MIKGKKWRSRIIQKNFGSSKKSKNVVKMTVFWLFLKNDSNDFDETCSECRTNQFWAPRDNRMSKSVSVLEIIIHKVQILAKIAKSMASKECRAHLENRKCCRKSDLIFRIHNKFSFLLTQFTAWNNIEPFLRYLRSYQSKTWRHSPGKTGVRSRRPSKIFFRQNVRKNFRKSY